LNFARILHSEKWFPALQVRITYLLQAGKRRLKPEISSQNSKSDPAETNRMLGISFKDQGMLERAQEKLLACPPDEDLLPVLYDLALAFENRSEFDQATSIYQHIIRFNPTFLDIQSRLTNAQNSLQTADKQEKSDSPHQRIGRYEIINELGKGAMGSVYLGKDPKINRNVAIKTMALSQEFEASGLSEVKAQFFHEAEIAGMLNHPNIVTIFDVGEEGHLAYIAMEYLDGIDLVPYSRKKSMLPLTTTLRIIAKVAEALKYAHAHGVIHRDIKPANIMILKNRTVKVTDFGIAHINDSSKTKAGIVLGTPSYMSPEQLSGKELDGRSDIFSLGVMLYEMTTGARPFRAESISRLMLKVAREPHIDPREHNAELPERVAELINNMLAKKAAQRSASADVVLNEIHLCLKELRQANAIKDTP